MEHLIRKIIKFLLLKICVILLLIFKAYKTFTVDPFFLTKINFKYHKNYLIYLSHFVTLIKKQGKFLHL